MQVIHVQVIRIVAAAVLLLLPFVAPMFPILDAGGHCDQQGQDGQSSRTDGDVEQGDAKLVGAIRLFFVETRGTVPRPVTPESSADAGVQFRAPVSKTVLFQWSSQEDEMGITCSTHGSGENCIKKV